MRIDLDTFLVAVYTTVDELYTSFFAPYKPSCAAAKPRMTDSEVIKRKQSLFEVAGQDLGW